MKNVYRVLWACFPQQRYHRACGYFCLHSEIGGRPINLRTEFPSTYHYTRRRFAGRAFAFRKVHTKSTATAAMQSGYRRWSSDSLFRSCWLLRGIQNTICECGIVQIILYNHPQTMDNLSKHLNGFRNSSPRDRGGTLLGKRERNVE